MEDNKIEETKELKLKEIEYIGVRINDAVKKLQSKDLTDGEITWELMDIYASAKMIERRSMKLNKLMRKT